MRNGFIAAFIGVFASLLNITAHASVDVVQSVPIETNLSLPNVQETQAAWIELINTAQSTIDLEEFYVQSGDSLVPVLTALKNAAARGVKIRMLLDAGFYHDQPQDADTFVAQTPGVQMKTIDFSRLGGIMHAKYFVVDNKKAYVGSANFDWLALSHIHEVGLKVDDAQISTGLTSIFTQDWAAGVDHPGTPATASGAKTVTSAVTSAISKKLDETFAPFLQIFASPSTEVPAGVNPTLPKILNMMATATTSIKIQMYEYATSLYGTSTKFKDLDNAIRAAAARGVKVQILVDKTALKAGSKDLKALNQIPNIKVSVITIPEWSGGHLDYARVAHSKYMITDDNLAWIGSENWSGGYFTSTRNVGLVTNDVDGVKKLVQIYSTVWNCGLTASP
jgi:phosphatidylserine/phosphatidylglycerophosphate/cardiolipin synthase-like enzyme